MLIPPILTSFLLVVPDEWLDRMWQLTITCLPPF